MHEPFSLLMPVYGGDRAAHVRRALRSAVEDQTVHPDQVVIVRDGPVDDDLAACLDDVRANCPVPVTFVPLPHHTGLGPTLDQGLGACWFDVVARMDADDIAMPHRFEVELLLIENADIVGSGLLEFTDDTDQIVGQRVPPVDPDRIRRYARMHDPFNHPTVVYRRSAVLAAGGYGDLPLMEDYSLFARMLQAGARPVNVPEPLVFYRVGSTAFKRRGGSALLRSELRLQREFRRLGFTTFGEFLRNVVIRGGYRLIPWWCRRAIYRPLVTRYANSHRPELEAPGEQPPADWDYEVEWGESGMPAAVHRQEPPPMPACP